MRLGKVVGTVTATRKDEKLVGSKLMLIQPLTSSMEPVGEHLIGVDTVGAGVDEIIIFASGTASRNAAKKPEAPIDIAIIGIVDNITKS